MYAHNVYLKNEKINTVMQEGTQCVLVEGLTLKIVDTLYLVGSEQVVGQHESSFSAEHLPPFGREPLLNSFRRSHTWEREEG